MTQKTALVTGAARGIGAGIARLLAQRGYEVAIADLEKPENGNFFVRTDVSREPSVRACVRAVVRELGRLDALINNAGIAGPDNGPVEKLALAEWNRRIGTNLKRIRGQSPNSACAYADESSGSDPDFVFATPPARAAWSRSRTRSP
jgi:NAD(P)-dependent dehydrogenase (short-subunit alcohol dehydrogenase family)